MSKFKDFQQMFSRHLSTLLDYFTKNKEDEIDDVLVDIEENEKVKDVIRKICEEINVEHELMLDMKKSGKTPGDWLESYIESTVTELYPNSTQQDVEKVKTMVVDAMEKEIDDASDLLLDECQPIMSNNSEEAKE